MAGRDVGRIRRFLPDRDPDTIEQKKREKDARETALQQLLRNPSYAAVYQAANDATDRAQAALDTALLENAQTTEDLAERLDEMEARAARLPDGRAVFRAADGSMRTADGQRLRSDALPASLIIPLDASSYEDYALSRDALTSARAHGQELSRVQTEVIDPARERLADEDNPLSLDELEALADRLDAVTHTVSRQEADLKIEALNDENASSRAEPTIGLPLDLPTLR
ncbi:hypothetical protein [Hyphobacterium sp.]|uniref:hypothetical protein n=1 Tax=Hyphobacterium sp. TaxID=2004662 RepID=UPI0037481171